MDKVLEFDYVVIGGGAGGCVIAARLAAESSGRVALLERGRMDDNRWLRVPGAFFKVLKSRDLESVISEPDRTLNGKPFIVRQGRVLGGGSSINGMVYMRGQAQDYDDWESLHGCTGWGYRDVLPVFKRQEKNTRLNNKYHGVSGKLIVDDPVLPHPVSEKILDAALGVGLPKSNDFNGASQDGAGWYQVTAHKGLRQSAADCFLRPEVENDALTVLTEHHVSRICFKNRRAVAVEAFDASGLRILFRAAREIILCAGSFHSPKLLMLSGIGRSPDLLRFGINVVQDSPEVGANFQDHVGTPVIYRLKKKIGLHGSDYGLKALKHGMNYFGFKRGLLTANLLQAGACVDTSGSGRPDVQFNFAPFAPSTPGSQPIGHHAMQIHPMIMRPKSRGRIGLNSRSPFEMPKLLTTALEQEHDMDVLRRGIRLARGICAQPVLREILSEEVWPGLGTSSAIKSSSLDCAIRRHARTMFHPAGTCRMGGDERSVVDPQLRVRGVDGLRVADCSIMPNLVSGNTNAPTMMIADRCADFILGA
ncbi:MAG: GMC family oxidoreductase N-terminal domain-containing protein [Pseudomonadota bacterium]